MLAPGVLAIVVTGCGNGVSGRAAFDPEQLGACPADRMESIKRGHTEFLPLSEVLLTPRTWLEAEAMTLGSRRTPENPQDRSRDVQLVNVRPLAKAGRPTAAATASRPTRMYEPDVRG